MGRKPFGNTGKFIRQSFREAASYDVGDVAREVRAARDSAKRRLGRAAPDRFELAPRAEGREQAGGDLRIA